MEPTEIQEFSKQMKEAGGEESLTQISLAISILAVLVAMVTVLGHRSHTEAVLHAGAVQLISGTSIRRRRFAKTTSRSWSTPSNSAPSPSAATQAKLTEYQAHIAKWKTELTEEQDKAREYEEDVRPYGASGRPLRSRRGSAPDRRRPLLRHAVYPQAKLLHLRAESWRQRA